MMLKLARPVHLLCPDRGHTRLGVQHGGCAQSPPRAIPSCCARDRCVYCRRSASFAWHCEDLRQHRRGLQLADTIRRVLDRSDDWAIACGEEALSKKTESENQRSS